MMVNKATVLKYINELPDEFPIEELMERLLFIYKVEVGLEESKKDQITPHDQVKERFNKWLK